MKSVIAMHKAWVLKQPVPYYLDKTPKCDITKFLDIFEATIKGHKTT